MQLYKQEKQGFKKKDGKRNFSSFVHFCFSTCLWPLEDFTKEEINRKIQNSFGIIHPHFYVQEPPTKKNEPGGIIWFLQTKFSDGEMSIISDQT